jgi:hypothetical protein
MTRVASLLLLVTMLPGCGSGAPPAHAPDGPSEDASNACEVKPALAATAKATPKALGCTDSAELVVATEGCNKGDAAQCYLVGVCFAVEVSMIGDKDPARRAKAIEQGKKAFRIACDGGIADGCDHRAGMTENQQTDPAARKEACADITRGCQLGKQVDCTECLGCPR